MMSRSSERIPEFPTCNSKLDNHSIIFNKLELVLHIIGVLGENEVNYIGLALWVCLVNVHIQ